MMFRDDRNVGGLGGDAAMEDRNDDGGFVSSECFRAYVDAEIKVPNTLIAVSPYVGRAALAPLQTGDDVESSVKRFAETYSFKRSQMSSAIKTVVLVHRRFGVPVLLCGADLQGRTGIRVFEQQRFEVVYMEGVLNILEAILRLHGTRGEVGSARQAQVAELLVDSDKLRATLAAFVAAENAINSPEATAKSEAFKAKFNFAASGERARAMAPDEKIAIQCELIPLITAAVASAVAECGSDVDRDRLDDFVDVLTSPELHEEAR